MKDPAFLHRYVLGNGGHRIHKWLHYFDIYERHFHRFRNVQPVIVEIGVAGGGSLRMWKDYFGPGCKVIGVDINPSCKGLEGDGIEIFIGSQDDPKLWNKIHKKYPVIDIVLDDGSHVMNHMISTFNILYEKISPLGVYLVEDTHTCYWKSHGGGLRNPDSFMEFAKAKTDELNAFHTKGALEPTDFTKSTNFIAFYDSIVVFEKKPQGHRNHIMTGGMNFSLKYP